MQAVIMAGGKGTRLLALTNDEIPKPMAPVCGKPILQRQIESLKQNGITDICIITGHLGEKISEFFGDGSAFGVSIRYFCEETPMGTAGALAHLDFFLREESFLLVFGDVIFDIDVRRMAGYHREKGAGGTLFIHPNSHPFDSDLVVLDGEGRVTGFDSKHNQRDYWYENLVNAGVYILTRALCRDIPRTGKTDLEKDVLLKNIQNGGNIYGYVSSEYVKDVGTMERITQAEEDMTRGIVARKNLLRPQKCIFLDRDGTINRDQGLIARTEDFELEPCAARAIGLINASPYLAAVVTNQPVVARGMCGIETVEEIHRKMSTLLGREGAYVDAVEYCPHHPHKGYPEENPAYKIPCECRKPGTLMVTQIADRLHVDLGASWMIGDTTRDIQTGKNAGLRTILVKTGEGGRDETYPAEPDYVCENLLEAVQLILKEETANGLCDSN